MWIFYLKLSAYNAPWIKRLYDNSSNPWKIIPSSNLTDTYPGKYLQFHSNLGTPANEIKCFPMYYKQIFKRGSENLSLPPSFPSAIAC